VRKTCPHCREEYEPEEWLGDTLKSHNITKLVRGKGCETCHHFGYRGRTAIHELLDVDDAMKKLIMKDPSSEKIRKQAVKSGMVSMIDDGIAKANEGITTVEEVLRVCGTTW
jgi:type II secretory ATPase GspE/PulE/Tfp pilus assembly ATPase PilB-like protein